MAIRKYKVNQHRLEVVSEASVPLGSDDIEFYVDIRPELPKADVLRMLEQIKQHIKRSEWPLV